MADEPIISQDVHKDGWFRIGDLLLTGYGRKLGPYGIAVYAVLATYADSQEQTANLSYQAIADMTGMSRRQAIRKIDLLISLGIVSREQRLHERPTGEQQHYPNGYRLQDKSVWKPPNGGDGLASEGREKAFNTLTSQPVSRRTAQELVEAECEP